MDYGMIGQIEKARQYVDQPERITFTQLTVNFRGDNDNYTVSLNDNTWHCTCPGFAHYGICPHIMTLERLFKPMLKLAPLAYAHGQNVVSDVEKAHRYADERDRLRIVSFASTFHGNNSEHIVRYNDGDWDSDSASFKMRGVSSHVIALERLLKGMVEPTTSLAEH
jgi:hypothetical protein